MPYSESKDWAGKLRIAFGVVATVAVVAGLLLTAPEEESGGGLGASGKHVVRVDLNVYTPGTIPQGIGDPVKVAEDLAKEWEADHPGMNVIYQPMVQTGSTEGEWLKTQLLGGIAPEIISMNAETAWPDVRKGWFVPLDEYMDKPNPYVPGNEHWIDLFANQALVNAKRAPDGKLYCVSLDIVETGIFYNKRMLREAGRELMPETWAEMMDVLQQFREAGEVPFTADGNLGTNWGMDIVFEMLYHDLMPTLDVVPSKPDAEGYLGYYLDPQEAGFLFTKGFFTRRDPRWVESARILREWRTYMAKEMRNADPVRLFLTERLAFYWSGSWFIRRMVTDPYVNFDWGVAYIPTITKATSPYGSGTPATVIGGAAVQLHVTNSALKNDNLAACVDYLMWLTAPQNIERLASEALVFIPNIRGAEMDERLTPFQEIFARPYCAMKWMASLDSEHQSKWRSMMDYYLEDGWGPGETGREIYLEKVEALFAAWVKSHRDDEGWDFEKMEALWKPKEEALLRELDPVNE